MNISNKESILLGIPVLVVSLFCLVWNAYLLYVYNFTNKMWLFMMPNSLLITNILIGLLGLTVSAGLILNKIRAKKGFVIFLFLLIFYIFLNTILIQFF